jgi:hypothetical protein
MNDIVAKILDSPAKACGISLTVLTLSYFAIKGLPSKKHKHSYPPGPPRHFLVGAMRSFPKDRFLDTFCDWARKYGRFLVYVYTHGSLIS